jgi:hypothetical protein
MRGMAIFSPATVRSDWAVLEPLGVSARFVGVGVSFGFARSRRRFINVHREDSIAERPRHRLQAQ